MKKLILAAVAVVTIGIVGVPTKTQAAPHVPHPTPVIGITEETFQEILDAQCSLEEAPCDTIVEKLAGHVVMRVEDEGQLYWINNKDGLPNVNRYLPDGFYKIKGEKKYFLVIDGKRIRIKKGEAFSKLLSAAQKGYITGVTQDAFHSMLRTCEYHPTTNADRTQYNQCVADHVAGNALQETLRGRFITIVENHGSLYYVPKESAHANLIPLGKKVNNKSFFSFAKKQAEPINSDQLRKLVKLRIFI